MAEQEIDFEKIKSIFYQHYSEQANRVKKDNTKFAYYTTSDVAFLILKNKEFWMRNAMTMNDYMEVEYGLNSVKGALDSASGDRFKESLNSLFPAIYNEVESMFKAWVPGMKLDTFITCFSEHQPKEDLTGRLSMWRAYGGRSGIAFIFNNSPMFLMTKALAAYSSPVAYFNQDEMDSQLELISKSIELEADFVLQLGRDKVKDIVFNMLRFAALCNKHPGFIEESEWRVISSPVHQSSSHIREEVEVVRGIPQTVLKIKLEDHPDQGLVGLELAQFLDKIIIGPCEFPRVLFRAIAKLLDEAGVPNPTEKIFISNIPLRHSS